MLPLILGLGGLALQGYGAYQQHKAGKEQDKYLEEQKAHRDLLEADAKRERLRDALARAIGADTQFKPYEAPKAPEAPDLSGYATRAGIAGLGSTALSDILAHPEWFKKLPGSMPEDIYNNYTVPGGDSSFLNNY